MPPKPPQFDPPCPLFGPTDDGSAQPGVELEQTVLELGSGTGFLSLAIAPSLRRNRSKKTALIMTDLDNVCPLLEDNLARAQQRWSRSTERDLVGTDPTDQGRAAAAASDADQVDVLVRPLPWGDETSLLRLVKKEEFKPDIILASDLIYFEFLYGPLLRTLIALTEPMTLTAGNYNPTPTTPTVIFSYKVRSLTREEPFWRAFGTFHLRLGPLKAFRIDHFCPCSGRWFELDPVQVGRTRRPDPPAAAPNADREQCQSGDPSPEVAQKKVEWTRYGSRMGSADMGGTSIGDKDDELYVFVCRRHPSTLGALGPIDAKGQQDGTSIIFGSVSDEELLLGLGKAAGYAEGADRFEEILLANLEWD